MSWPPYTLCPNVSAQHPSRGSFEFKNLPSGRLHFRSGFRTELIRPSGPKSATPHREIYLVLPSSKELCHGHLGQANSTIPRYLLPTGDNRGLGAIAGTSTAAGPASAEKPASSKCCNLSSACGFRCATAAVMLAQSRRTRTCGFRCAIAAVMPSCRHATMPPCCKLLA